MSVTSDELNAFHRFALARLASDNAETLHQLVDLWEAEHPSATIRVENVAAIRAAILDMENGDTGRDAKLVIAELRSELAGRLSQ